MVTAARDVRAEVERLLRLLQEAGIAPYINPVVIKRRADGVRVTWGSSRETSGALFRGEFASIEEYCNWLDANAFSAVLYDGAILHISYDFVGAELVGHRLGYYPCPFDLDQELVEQEPILDVVSIYRGRDDSLVRLRSPIRFDYSSKAQGHDHPAVHLTLLWRHCRWAVFSPLSPGHFVRFVFKHFYPDLWRVHHFLRDWPQWHGDRTITKEQETTLHVACMRPEVAGTVGVMGQ